MFLKIQNIFCLDDYMLQVKFNNGITKLYDVKNLFSKEPFTFLKNRSFFKTASIDPGGHGISWNDQIDLSEHELWSNGQDT